MLKSYLVILAAFIMLYSCSNSATEPIQNTDVSSLSAPQILNVPSGSFTMGNAATGDNSLPEHQVAISSFNMSKCLITNKQYCEMLNYALSKGYLSGEYSSNVSVRNKNGDSQELLKLNGVSEYIYCEISYNNGKFVVDYGKLNRPVSYITWYGAAFYCNMLNESNGLSHIYNILDWSCNYSAPGYRLPTEGEWEYAARYGDGRLFPWGNTSPTNQHANYSNYLGCTTDVGSYPLGNSQLGFCDMAGNLWEWCSNWQYSYSVDSQTNPVGPSSGDYKVLRGGSYYVNETNIITTMRLVSYQPYVANHVCGFRIVKK